jgi:hypothetical protein
MFPSSRVRHSGALSAEPLRKELGNEPVEPAGGFDLHPVPAMPEHVQVTALDQLRQRAR